MWDWSRGGPLLPVHSGRQVHVPLTEDEGQGIALYGRWRDTSMNPLRLPSGGFRGMLLLPGVDDVQGTPGSCPF